MINLGFCLANNKCQKILCIGKNFLSVEITQAKYVVVKDYHQCEPFLGTTYLFAEGSIFHIYGIYLHGANSADLFGLQFKVL